MPHFRYKPAHERVHVALDAAARTWPSRRITQAPLWVPVDLRDGNQALPEPMNIARKQRMFNLLAAMGFKEIEVAYPSASQTDFDFVRQLVTSGAVPDDVTVSVFTPARTELIDRTLDSVLGLPRVLVHMYTATAPTWRNVVLGRGRSELKQMILNAAAELMRGAAEKLAGTDARFEFSPEVFNLTEPDFVLEVCNSITELWDACADRPVVINLPATVEIATPSVYADQIEYMSRHLERRDSVILSVHPHNDRGTGVACAELAMLAGAQRVEGCLFGNGERTGNVDLVTLVLNLYTQGINPMIDVSDIDAIAQVVEDCINIPVHVRHPYAGALVHTAFSGTHQDAIAKGLARHQRDAAELQLPEAEAPWNVPYLPIDPVDIGRTYEEVIRINSQSGKGGIAHLLNIGYGLDLPPAMRPDFYQAVQEVSDVTGRELAAEDLWKLYHGTYLNPAYIGQYLLSDWAATSTGAGSEHEFTASISMATGSERIRGRGNGPLAALAAALAQTGTTVDILSYSEHATTSGPDATAAAYVLCRVGDREVWGAGWDTSILTASVQAVLSAVNRAYSQASS